jgi:hypothetical protein
MFTFRFWPLDFDPEGEIYENPAWDLPGFRKGKKPPVKTTLPGERRSRVR